MRNNPGAGRRIALACKSAGWWPTTSREPPGATEAASRRNSEARGSADSEARRLGDEMRVGMPAPQCTAGAVKLVPKGLVPDDVRAVVFVALAGVPGRHSVTAVNHVD